MTLSHLANHFSCDRHQILLNVKVICAKVVHSILLKPTVVSKYVAELELICGTVMSAAGTSRFIDHDLLGSLTIKLNCPETTVYSDRLSLHYPPISDAFDNIENFFCIIQMIQH